MSPVIHDHSTTGVSEDEENRSMTERGDDRKGTCCLGMKTPSIILRNIILPKEMWDEFPRGLNLNVSDYFLYQPCHPYRVDVRSIRKPTDYGMIYEQVWITTKDDIKLYAFLIKTRIGKPDYAPTMIFFHGNAGSIGDRLDNAKILHLSIPINILLVEYRGYGPSKGIPSEKGFYRDAKAAFEYVTIRKDLHSAKIFVFGRSLGGAVAIHLASRRKFRTRLAGLIVENTFTSIPSLARKIFLFPGVRYLPRWFYNNKYDNKDKVGALRAPSLFITSKNDELLPPDMMKKLCATTGSAKKEIREFYAGHNDAYLADGYPQLIYQFMMSCVGHIDPEPVDPFVEEEAITTAISAVLLDDQINNDKPEVSLEYKDDEEKIKWEATNNFESFLESPPGAHHELLGRGQN